MATRNIIVDDLDGSEGDVETISFAFEGGQYVIDLSMDNYLELRGFMLKYIKAGRYMRGTVNSRIPDPKPEPTRTELAAEGDSRNQLIRSWYDKQPNRFRNEHPLKGNGRIPQAIQDAFDREHQGNGAAGAQPAFSG